MRADAAPQAQLTQLTQRQMQGKASREAILEAATQLMSEKGYDAVSISELTKVSGLPASSIYWHFKSKRGVLGAVLEAEAERFFAEFRPTEHLLAVPPRERIRVANRYACAAIQAHSDFGRLRILLLLVDTEHGREREIILKVRRRSKELLRMAIAQTYCELGEETAAAVADQLIDLAQSMFDGAFLAVLYDPQLSLAELLDKVSDAILTLGDKVVAASG